MLHFGTELETCQGSVILGGMGGTSTECRETLQKGPGTKPHTFLKGLPALGTAQTPPKMTDLQQVQTFLLSQRPATSTPIGLTSHVNADNHKDTPVSRVTALLRSQKNVFHLEKHGCFKGRL